MRNLLILTTAFIAVWAGPVEKRSPTIDCSMIRCYVPDCDKIVYPKGSCCGVCAKPSCRFGTNGQTCGGSDGVECEDPKTECVLGGSYPNAEGDCCFKSRQTKLADLRLRSALRRLMKRLPGRCPKPDGYGICLHGCIGDEDCSGSKKCCYNGCGYVCTDVI